MLELATDAALAHTPKATQHPPGQTGETPEGAKHGNVQTFLKEALATALQVIKLPHSIIRIFLNYYSPQGNEDFRLMVDQHDEVAQEAATRIDELEEERNIYFTNSVELTSTFREMKERYKHPREVNLASRSVKEEVSQEARRASHQTLYNQTTQHSYPRDIAQQPHAGASRVFNRT